MLEAAQQQTIYFIGVTTGKSSIMKLYPLWREILGLKDTRIIGIDLKIHDEPEAYRDVVKFIKNDAYSMGSLITTHKIDMYNACKDMFDYFDSDASMLGEISCISKNEKKLIGHAKDPISSGLALEAFLTPNYWKETGAEVFVLGAGGSSLAITAYLMKEKHKENIPSHIIVCNRSISRLEEMIKIHSTIKTTSKLEYYHTPRPENADKIMNLLKPYSLVINATGLGKDRPGSPITDNAFFPEHGIAWDFNYRGNLLFLEQARVQAKKRNLHIEDGWIYFIHGWTQVIFEIFHLNVGTEKFSGLVTIANGFYDSM